MITLHIAKLLEDEGFGTLDTDIFWEEVALDTKGDPKEGIWIVTRSSEVSRLRTTIVSFDIYARYANKITTQRKLEDILEFLRQAYGEVCTLPIVPPYSTAIYNDVQIMPTSSVESVGSDEQEKIVKVISGEIRYSKGDIE